MNTTFPKYIHIFLFSKTYLSVVDVCTLNTYKGMTLYPSTFLTFKFVRNATCFFKEKFFMGNGCICKLIQTYQKPVFQIIYHLTNK